jgi:hypothetical protein
VVLSRIAQEHATGALHIARTGLVAEEGQVYVHAGQVYAATAGRERFPIGARLVTAYGLSTTALEEALAAQAGELTGWRIGEILVHLGHVDASTIEEASREQLLDAVTDMSGWQTGTWRFRIDERTRTMVSAALPWAEVATLITERQAEWEALLPVVRGAHAVPLPVAVGQSFVADAHLDPVTAALLTRIDGVRTLAEVAHDRGLSVLETGRALASLSAAGAVRIGEASSGGSAMAMLDALSLAPDPEPVQDVVAPVVDLTAARQARAADEAARVQARREADDTELAEAARRSAEAQALLEAERQAEAARATAEQEARLAEQAFEAARIEASRIEAERLAAEQAALRERAEAQAREAAAAADAERRARVAAASAASADEEARRHRREVLEAEREAQRAAEAEALEMELSLADQLRSVSGPTGDTSELAAALSAALSIPAQPTGTPEPSPFADVHDLGAMQAEESETADEPAQLAPLAAAIVPPPGPGMPGMNGNGMPVVRSGEADMASLFRELSSLGDDATPPPPRGAPARPPGAVDPKAKKKKGLFGR